MDTASTILRSGETCWRVERANRMSVIIDAAAYFATLKHLALKARHSMMMIGWEFDTRIELDPLDGSTEVPNRLGRFLSWLVKHRPELQIHILEWDTGIIFTLGRGSTPLRIMDLMASKQIRFKLDHAHPRGAAHHQKIVVIDDLLAFCGGIDVTAGRWDTRKHPDNDPHRVSPLLKRPCQPWHDVTTLVDGDAAKALGELARGRWLHASGETLAPPPAVPPIWPDDLAPTMEDVDVAIARTAPEYAGRKGVYEIEALYLAIIRSAKRTLYIESQYFASHKVAEAIADRLREPDGPEIVVVNPQSADGWLEEEVMGSSRARMLRLVQAADAHGRFRLYYPVTQGGTPIYVHAKVLIMDDRLVRVGSSNLNNRSMGFDTECDLAVEVLPGCAEENTLREKVVRLRSDLLAEHLGTVSEAVEEAIAGANGSLIGGIEALRSSGRSLVPFELPELNVIEEKAMAENELLDPERPSRPWRRHRLTGFLNWARTRPTNGGVKLASSRREKADSKAPGLPPVDGV